MKIEKTLRDVVGVAGVALLGYGLWLHYPPLGFIGAGTVMLGLAIAGTVRAQR